MICPKCNKIYPQGKRFCGSCGAELVEEVASASDSIESTAQAAPGTVSSVMPADTARISATVTGTGDEGSVCPSCGRVNKPGARFCAGCGYNIGDASVPAPVTPSEQKVPEEVSVSAVMPQTGDGMCPSCGRVNRPGARFCAGCGFSFASAEASSAVQTPAAAPVASQTPDSAPEPVPMPAALLQPAPEMPDMPGMPGMPSQPERKNNSKGSGGQLAIIIAASVLVLALICGGIFGVVKSGVIQKLTGKQGKPGTAAESVKEDDREDGKDVSEDLMMSVEEADALLKDADALAQTGFGLVEAEETLYDGLDTIEEALELYFEKASEMDDISHVQQRLEKAFEIYQDAACSRVVMLNESEIGGVDTGSRYDQMMEVLDEVLYFGDEAEEYGFRLDCGKTEQLMAEIAETYPKRVIEEFNRYTGEKLADGNWSRTEAYNLMCGNDDLSGTEGMFEADDFDNPVHTRYCFALAYYQIKMLNKAVHEEKTQTPGAAAKSIAGIISAVDYSPLLVRSYIDFRKEAELDYGEAEEALDDVKNYLKENGIDIDQIGWEHFWYFNEIGSESSAGVEYGDWDGVTPETRQWIRNRLSLVEY